MKQLRADLRVGQPIPREPRDLRLLRGQIIVVSALRLRTVCPWPAVHGGLARRTPGPHRLQHLVGHAKLSRASTRHPYGATTRRRANEPGRDPAGAGSERADRSPRGRDLRRPALTHQSSRPGLDAHREIGAAGRVISDSRSRASAASSAGRCEPPPRQVLVAPNRSFASSRRGDAGSSTFWLRCRGARSGTGEVRCGVGHWPNERC